MDLPYHIIEHILSFTDIDTRLAFKIKPKKLVISDEHKHLIGNIPKIQRTNYGWREIKLGCRGNAHVVHVYRSTSLNDNNDIYSANVVPIYTISIGVTAHHNMKTKVWSHIQHIRNFDDKQEPNDNLTNVGCFIEHKSDYYVTEYRRFEEAIQY